MTVRSFSNEMKMVSLYSQDIDKSYNIGKKLAFFTGTFMGVVTMLMYVSKPLQDQTLLLHTVHFDRELQLWCYGMVATLFFMANSSLEP